MSKLKLSEQAEERNMDTDKVFLPSHFIRGHDPYISITSNSSDAEREKVKRKEHNHFSHIVLLHGKLEKMDIVLELHTR